MKSLKYILFFILAAFHQLLNAQINNPAPYCNGGASTGVCNQPGPSNSSNNGINDFINDFNTCGANTDIVNNNSGCNGLANNYIYYNTTNPLVVAPGQIITCNIRSGITFAQGFAIFIDWNQNGTFDVPAERVAATSNAPAASTWTTLTFTIPLNQALGNYRMRVRCSFAQGGTTILPCGQQSFSETEDYNLTVVGNNSSGVITASVTSNSPLCSGQTLSLGVTSTPSVSVVSWSGPGSFTSAIQNPVLANASPTMNGIYTVTLGTGGCPTTATVNVQVAPSSTFVLATSANLICQGGSFNASMTINNSNQFAFAWQSPNGGIVSPSTPVTLIQPPLLPTSVTLATNVYTAIATPTLPGVSCPTQQTFAVTVSNPSTPTLNMPGPLCNTFNGVQLTASPGGGTWSANAAVSPSGFFTPSLAVNGTNTVLYTVSVGICPVANTGTVEVSRFHTSALSSNLPQKCVQDAPYRMMNIVLDSTTGFWSYLGVNLPLNYFTFSGRATGNYALTYHSPSSPNPTVCPSTTVLSVFVFNPPTPTINPIAERCSNSSTVVLAAGPNGGVWSGNSGVSFNGVQTPSLNNFGLNMVTYSAGQGTCLASSSRTFQVSQFISAELTGSINPLCANNGPVNLMTIVQNTTGTWSGINVGNKTFDPTALSTGTYSLRYRVLSSPNQSLCPDSSRITVSVLNPPMPNIVQLGPVCSTSPAFQLTVSPASGNWVVSSFVSPSGRFTPSLAPVGNAAVQYVIGTSTCNSQQTQFINVEAFVPATIVSAVPDLCNNSAPLSLLPLTLNTFGNWSGPGVIGTNFDPAITDAGEYFLTYKTASSPSGLCPDTDTLAVKVFSLAAPIVSQAGPFCNTSPPVQLIVSPVGGLFATNNSQAVNLQGLFNPALGVIGKNLVSYSISSGPCIAYTESFILIEEFISAAIDKQVAAAYCKNEDQINLHSIVRNPGYRWTGPGVNPAGMFDPLKANIGDNILFYETRSFPNGLLCPDVSSLTIKVVDIPKISAFTNTLMGCNPLKVTFNGSGNKNGKGNWVIDNGVGSQEGLSITQTFTNAGTYHVLYQYYELDAPKCKAQMQLSAPIVVLETPQADFSLYPNEVYISDPQVTATNLSSDLYGNIYQWTIQNGLPIYDVHPNISFPGVGTYKITMQATGINNCKTEVSKWVEVKNDFNVFIPNSFTPNFDGLNDYFLPVFSAYGLNPSTFEMEIYDRWGAIVFKSNDHTKGWDGSINELGGLIVKQDTYTYRIRYRDLEARSYTKFGVVILLR